MTTDTPGADDYEDRYCMEAGAVTRGRVVGSFLIPTNDNCGLCGGTACEEMCGRCEMAYAGPDSHRVCSRCRGSGRDVDRARSGSDG